MKVIRKEPKRSLSLNEEQWKPVDHFSLSFIFTNAAFSSGLELCMCASHGDLDTLLAWLLAGADLSQSDYDGRTPLHIVSQSFIQNQGKTRFISIKTLFF